MSRQGKIGLVALVSIFGLLIVAVASITWQRDRLVRQLFAPPEQSIVKPGVALTETNSPLPSPGQSPKEADIEIIADNLAIPWEIAFLPDQSMLVTERPGRLVKINQDKTTIPVEGVAHTGEGGLLGLALHPNFASNQHIYLYLTTPVGEGLRNRVERYRLVGERLTDRTVIIDNIPGARFHDGGRLAFGPDNLLYITTGDAGNEDNAQNRESLAGKILRLNDDGTTPPGNPFNTAIYSYGHRNPQGLAWDEQGRLWATEHGRSGVRSGFDELNLITAGNNYGWPTIQGDQSQVGLTTPAINSGPTDTWAPSGAAFLDGSIFFAGLRGEALYEASINGQVVTGLTRHFVEQFGRLRAVVVGPDGWLYLATSNTDGRGQEQPADDKIIRVNPSLFR